MMMIKLPVIPPLVMSWLYLYQLCSYFAFITPFNQDLILTTYVEINSDPFSTLTSMEVGLGGCGSLWNVWLLIINIMFVILSVVIKDGYRLIAS